MQSNPAVSPLRAVSGRKLQSLDGLRAAAILLVIFHHVWLPPDNLFLSVAGAYLSAGWMGVDLFFVLSGFLITGILLDSRESSNYFKGFYARRALRIFPLYYLALTALILMGEVFTRMHLPAASQVASELPAPQDRWLYYSYLTNWVGLWKTPWRASMTGHFWSLAVEEQFYLVWPLIVWIAKPRATRWIAVILAVVAAAVRYVWFSHTGPQVAIALATVTRMDSLFCGALAASLYRDRHAMAKIRRWLPWVSLLCVGGFVNMITLMLLFPAKMAALIFGNLAATGSYLDAITLLAQRGGYSILAVGFGALVLWCADSEGEPTWTQRVLRTQPLGTIAKYSYGMYVFHVPILEMLGIYVVANLRAAGHYGMWTCFVLIAILLVATFVVSALSYELFEQKILSYKRYFEPKRDTRVQRLAAKQASA